MKIKLLVGFGLTILMLGLIIGLGAAQEPGEPPPQANETPKISQRAATDALAAANVVTSTFSYQGVLKEDGEPVTGNREMVFRLYADATCLDLVGQPMTYTVPVNNGLFNLNLRVNQRDFNGQALWLETEVGGIAVGCQAIQAAPYALGLRPGAIISGSMPNGVAVTAINTSTEGNAVRGLAGSGNTENLHPGASFYNAAGEFAGLNGIIGAASEDTSDGYGVIGLAQGSFGRGVYGYASNESGPNYGVYGESRSSSGYGVYGRTSAMTGTTYGVYGNNYSDKGYGVYGYAQAITGTTYGVYGQSRSPYGAGGYFANTGASDSIDLVVGGGVSDDGIISSEPSKSGSDLFFDSNDEVWVRLDQDDNEEGNFEVINGNNNTVFQVDEDGNVSQPQAGNGLVKASALVYCTDTAPHVRRYFNNISGSGVSVIAGSNSGECTIDFNFDLSDRFWSVSAVWNAARGVVCEPNTTYTDRLNCFRFNENGSGQGGDIMVIIY